MSDQSSNEKTQAEENNGNAAADTNAAGTEGKRKPDLLTPSSREAKELEQFIERGHRSVHTVRILTVLGILILMGALFYWEKADLYPVAQDSWQNFGNEYLPTVVRNQTHKEADSYRWKPTVQTAPPAPFWPNVLYRKLRMDIYIIGGIVFILCWIVIRIEGAKYMRNDLLAFRALAREIEKLRLRVRELEGTTKKDSTGSKEE